MPSRAGLRAALAAVALAAATLLPAAAAAQEIPPLERLLENARTRADSIAIIEAYRAALDLGDAAPLADVLPDRPERGERGAAGDDGERAAAGIPAADAVYEILLGQADTVAPGRGPITYRGERLVFYPETEVIVLEGSAAAEQAGTELEARRILYRSREGVVEAFEGASVTRGGSRLGADSLFYDRQTGAVATFGVSSLAEGGSETVGVDLRYDLERKSGRLGGGVTTYDPWILEGASMAKVGASTFLLSQGYFTTCDLEEPHYRFRADEIKLRKEDVIVARPVVLYFSDIPVFYLPWYVEPATRGRHTGFLRPQIGLNTLLFGTGQERHVRDLGYYYVFNDYSDAKIAADLYTESRTILRGDFRYSVRHEFEGSAHVEQVWNRLDDSSSRLVRYTHNHTFSRSTRMNVDVNWSNSRSFFRRNSFDPQEILQRSFRSAASYSTRFGWGSFVAGSSADFQLDSERTDYRLPDLRVSINTRPLWGGRPAARGEGSWLQRIQYGASASFVSRLSRAPVDSLGDPLGTIPTDSLGNRLDVDTGTVTNRQEGSGRFSLTGPLDLFGIFKTTPSLSYSLNVENDQLAEDEKFGGRGQANTSLSMNTRFFRIFRSMPGPWFTAMRHSVSPTMSIAYSPKPHFFGSQSAQAGTGTETLLANFSLSQDFEVKLPVRREEEPVEGEVVEGEAVEGEAVEGEAVEGEPAGEAEGEPAGEEDVDLTPLGIGAGADQAAAREQVREDERESRTVTLLSVVNSMSWNILDWKKEGRIGLSDLSTRLTSGLGQSFNVSASMNHSLVEQEGSGDDLVERFDPFLNRLTLDFTMRGGRRIGARRSEAVRAGDVKAGRGGEEEMQEAQQSLAASRAPGEDAGIGPWSVSLTHSWTRSREGTGNRQSLGIGLELLPSPNWSLNYRTTYDITSGELQGQTLSFVRDLHDWQASLGINVFPSEPQDRILISFSVFLRDVPDLEVPYQVRRE